MKYLSLGLLLTVCACSRSHGNDPEATEPRALVVEHLASLGGVNPRYPGKLHDPAHPGVQRFHFGGGDEAWLDGEPIELDDPWDSLLARSVAGEPFAFLATSAGGSHSLRHGAADWFQTRPGARIGDTEYAFPTWVRWADDGSLTEYPLPEGVAQLRVAPAPAGGIYFFGSAPGSVELGGGRLGPDDSPVTFLARLGLDGELSARRVGSDGIRLGNPVVFADGTLGLVVGGRAAGGEFLGEVVEPETQSFVRFDPESLERSDGVPLGEFPVVLYATDEGVKTDIWIMDETIAVGGEAYRRLDWSAQTHMEILFPEAGGAAARVETWPILRRIHPHVMGGTRQTAERIPNERWLGPSGAGSRMVYAWFERPDIAEYLVATDGFPTAVFAEENRVVAVVRSRGPLQVGGETLPSRLDDADSLFVLAFDGSVGTLDRWIQVPLSAALAPVPDEELVADPFAPDEHTVALTTGWAEGAERTVQLWPWSDASAGPWSELLLDAEGPGCYQRTGLWRLVGDTLLSLETYCDDAHEVRVGEQSWSYRSPSSATHLVVSLEPLR